MRRLWMVWACAAVSLSACGDDDKTEPALDGGAQTDGGAPGSNAGMLACFSGTPTTHLELINACTSAEGVEKTPVLPLLLIDGGLPPLP